MKKLKITEMHRLSIEEFKHSEKLPVAVVLDNVRSLYNVGSVFRTCDAFRVSEILLCGVTACPPNVEIHKTALGAEDSVDWKFFQHTDEAIDYLRSKEYTVYSVEQCEGSQSIEQVVNNISKGKYALVFGNEVSGVQQHIIDQCNGCIEIPQFGTKHSLNVSVATGVVVWEFFKALQPLLDDRFSQ